jgi:hypothetical protein
MTNVVAVKSVVILRNSRKRVSRRTQGGCARGPLGEGDCEAVEGALRNVRKRSIASALATALLVLAPAAMAAGPDERSLVGALNVELLANDSATTALQHWCAARHLADPPAVTASRVRVKEAPATAEVRALLRAAPREIIRYRRVELACGGHLLSVADNWYRPGQLTDQMNRALETTNEPFGLVVRPLGFHRVRLEARVLVFDQDAPLPNVIIRHKALLERADGTPFSLVIETYRRGALDASPARPRARPPGGAR